MGKKAPSWILDTYTRVLKEKFERQVQDVASVEWGTARALAAAFGDKRISPLPTYERFRREYLSKTAKLPAWMEAFEQANKEKKVK